MIPGDTYQVLTELDFSYLISDVNNAMKEGWVPVGGLFWDPKNDLYCQAMTREAP